MSGEIIYLLLTSLLPRPRHKTFIQGFLYCSRSYRQKQLPGAKVENHNLM